MIQLLRIKGKIKEKGEINILILNGNPIPLKFQVTMAGIIETIFGLIGLVIIFFGKSFAYAFYQIFIYFAFIIMRADNGKLHSGYFPNNLIKLSAFDYIISFIMILLTIGCMIVLIKRKN